MLWNHFSDSASLFRLEHMPKPPIPSTPLQIFTYLGDMEESAFKVQRDLANEEDLREIKREETRALAQLIYNAFKEWKQQ